jgi:hypothetical protein
MLSPCDNDGFSVPVDFRSFVPVLDKGIAIACGTSPKMPAVGTVGIGVLIELAICTRIER